MENIEQRIRKIVAEQLGVNEAEVKNESSFVNDLGADSLDTVELVMALEEELLEQGFEKIGPITASEFGEKLVKLLSEDSRSIQIYPFYRGKKGVDNVFMVYYLRETPANQKS